MKVKYIIGVDVAKLDRMIELAGEAATTMKNRVQVAAVAILHHAFEHGDYTRAATLVNVLGDGVRSEALIEFFVKFGGLIVDEEEGGFNGWSGAEFIEAHFQNAKATPWYELKKVNPWAGYSLEDELLKLITRHNNMMKKAAALEDGDEDASKIDFEVKQATLETVVRLCDFEAVVSSVDAELEQAIGDEEPVAATG